MGSVAEQEVKTTKVERPLLLRKAAVLGAGTMGSRIAAQLANVGLNVLLLDLPSSDLPSSDLPSSEAGRNAVADKALEALKKSKPAAFYTPSAAMRIQTGNFEDDLAQLAEYDWIVEAVTENLEIKQQLLARVAPHVQPHAFLTTNTSGIPVASIASVLPPELSRRWFGTHFFNPPRYMRLVEVVPGPATDPAAMAALSVFLDQNLGKEVVRARDTPNFIANRIGIFFILETLRVMREEDLNVEEVDALTGTAIGLPRTGTFRLADMVGLDILAHVARNFAQARTDAGGQAALPPFLETMLERKWLGDKTGGGFYKKERGADGKEVRFVLDLKTLEYQPASKPRFPALDMAKNVESLPERLRMLLSGDQKKDKAARFHWKLLTRLWNYSADCLPEIADSAANIDAAMRAGYNWQLGPFEMWDAAGVAETVARMRAAGEPISPVIEAMLASGAKTWYADNGAACYDLATRRYQTVARPAGIARIASFRASNGVVRANPGASLIDLGDGVGCIELHSTKSTMGDDIMRLITKTLEPSSEFVRDFRAFVISSDAENFSVGANLMQLLLAAQEGEWEDIDLTVRAFQRMTQSIKFCPRPVVVAPYALCLGGGTEISLHGARRQAHAELYMGLVETGVGLIPGGGGTKEFALKATDEAIRAFGDASRVAISTEIVDTMKQAFETIAMAKVSTSAAEARSLNLLTEEDGITLNRERLLLEAKNAALALADAGHLPPVMRSGIPAAGESVRATLRLGAYIMQQSGYASEHDVKVAGHVAHILCGGSVAPGTRVSEQYYLDLEREAFLSLCGERKTQERIAYTLSNGKPLRN
ncbi:3-hydroxyacyl-CoA dehydrogenase/enoyl-CoA hydratase family protein [Terriglobus albidus]|uniref:3-hydroxyacyl-CoA dehydrogenase/enoyl-CoA hydratase family protein n=1 Tax=Terriglobus albidus TaxID=1592106 RepID=UPI0021E02F2E|nr:3-hydroxyacyl-CoA dehydrogenase/enoyl-CoA hydratase family protein [Terriglobus albidus]